MISRRVIFVFSLTAFFLLTCTTIPTLAHGQQSWTIQTFAGGGPNNIPASGTAVGDVGGVATDSTGTLYISGSFEGEVWKVVNGNVVIVAGAGVGPGQYSYAGDGGPATEATLFSARKIAFDQNGNFFLPDDRWNRVRKVDQNGIITLFAGNGVFPGGICAFDGDGPATQHSLCQPVSTAVDAQGNVYIADALNNRIRKVDAAGNMTTFAGNGALNVYGQCVYDGEGPATQHALCSPVDVVFDSHGNLYIADALNNRIRKVDTSGSMTTVAGNGSPGFSGDGGQARVARLNYPGGIAFDVAGNMYIGDSANSRVRKIDTSDIINTIAGDGNCPFDGDGPALQHSICSAGSLALDSAGNVYVADGNLRVRMVNPQGNLTTIAGNGTIFDSGNGGPATQQPVYIPYSVATDPAGDVYAMDCYGLRKIDLQGNISPLTGKETMCLYPHVLSGLAVDGSGNTYYTASNYVFKKNSQGTIAIAGTGVCAYDGDGPATQHSLCNPEGLVVDSAGNVFIADTDNNLVRKVDTSGNMTTIGGYYFNPPLGCSFDGDGPATSHKLCFPWGLAMNAAGDIYLSDSGNLRVRVISQANSTIMTIAGSGMLKQNGQCIFDGDGSALQHSLCAPTGVAVLPSGDAFVIDSGNIRVREISGGTMTTIAGNGISGFGGDGGPATAALLNNPLGLASDGSALYIADAYNNRVRRLTAAAATTTTLSSSPNPSHIGQTVLLTAKVTASSGTPTGNLTFYDGATPLGTVVLKQGVATLKISSLSLGIHSLTASYAGNGTFASSISAALSQTVKKAVPSITLLSTPNPSKPKQQVTFSVVVSGKAGVPTGSVTLKQGTKILGTATLANGGAKFVVAFSTAGTYIIVAHYSGDQNYSARNSIGLSQVVN